MSSVEYLDWQAKLSGDADVQKLVRENKMDLDMAWNAVWGPLREDAE